MRALIVDDEEDIGFMVSKVLAREGIEADCVGKIHSAREMIRKKDYEIVLLDLNLPDGNGFDLMPMIRKVHSGSKIIIISAHDGTKETNRAKELGIEKFIKKPFSKYEIIQAIRETI